MEVNISCEQIIHDIKTPLSIMYNNIREIEWQMSPSMRDSVEELKQNWLRILKLVTDAGDYQKLSRGLLLPNFSNQDVVALVRDITESTRSLAVRKNIRLMFECELEKKEMAIDKDIIDRILLNLLSNAVKFTDQNGEIKVKLRENGDMLCLTVQDSGAGISAEYASRIFEPYFLEQSAKNKSGTGIGLYIVKELVTLLGGEIILEPQKVGTALTLSLPCFVLEDNSHEMKFYDDFYSDNMVQIELSDSYYL